MEHVFPEARRKGAFSANQARLVDQMGITALHTTGIDTLPPDSSEPCTATRAGGLSHNSVRG